jgi:hypothetical protein
MRRHTIRGRYGTYLVPTVQAVDVRCATLVTLLATATPDGEARIRDDLDTLLAWRLELMRGASA